MPTPFTPEQLAELSTQIDEQLQQLREEPPPAFRKGSEPDKQEVGEQLPAQWQTIAKLIKEEPRSFWQRFKQAAHKDLCEEGGVLHTQWQKWGDLSNEAVLKSFGAVLTAMGFSGNALHMLAVALGVIVLHIGLKAVCAEA